MARKSFETIFFNEIKDLEARRHSKKNKKTL